MSMTSAYSASLPLCSESRATAAASVPVWQLATAPAMAADIWRACERDQVEELKEALDSGVDCNAQVCDTVMTMTMMMMMMVCNHRGSLLS